jgi:hypothetical protein
MSAMTLAEQDFWLAEAEILHSREEVSADDALEAYEANREWGALQLAAHEWVVA